ncbi:neuferricin isoform X1 [Latimeria chalumnae]|uniref:neuferricin isoform X1 n=1 Tax=Latimeria chalumnae TaxID=7897 RepID=UPI0003C122FA|nr:PREDICTED: neuferricin isoform X1 [Latimeria chalumnae]|eukprot:XP_006007296.1 PREDICTED: neuferricin isoform X1 [Latimeria chalumnae]
MVAALCRGERGRPAEMLRCFLAAVCAAVALLFGFDPSVPGHLLDGLSRLLAVSGLAGSKPVRLLSKAELCRYNGGADSPGLYLAVLGQVFDVKKGMRQYGPGGSYSFFAGKDASRAFVTGDFTEMGLVEDVAGLSPSEMVALHDWLSFYKKDYIFVGKLIGQFYDEHGDPTESLKEAEALVAEGQRLEAQSEAEKKQFPPCNSEWNSVSRSRVWCSKFSGGVERDWVGVPRKLYKPGSSGFRCVCVRTSGPPSSQPTSQKHSDRGDLDSPQLQEYEGCLPFSESCSFKN